LATTSPGVLMLTEFFFAGYFFPDAKTDPPIKRVIQLYVGRSQSGQVSGPACLWLNGYARPLHSRDPPLFTVFDGADRPGGPGLPDRACSTLCGAFLSGARFTPSRRAPLVGLHQPCRRRYPWFGDGHGGEPRTPFIRVSGSQ